jgi:hypothetical protein
MMVYVPGLGGVNEIEVVPEVMFVHPDVDVLYFQRKYGVPFS